MNLHNQISPHKYIMILRIENQAEKEEEDDVIFIIR